VRMSFSKGGASAGGMTPIIAAIDRPAKEQGRN